MKTTNARKLSAAALALVLMGATVPLSEAQEAQPQEELTADSQGKHSAQGEAQAPAGNAVHPPGASPWSMRLQIAFLFPKMPKK